MSPTTPAIDHAMAECSEGNDVFPLEGKPLKNSPWPPPIGPPYGEPPPMEPPPPIEPRFIEPPPMELPLAVCERA